MKLFKDFREQKIACDDEETIRKQQDLLEEHKYKMEHDFEYRECIKKEAAFFRADSQARKAAGLENKVGSYSFTCPNCGTKCKGTWICFDDFGYLHGRTGCSTCGIYFQV